MKRRVLLVETGCGLDSRLDEGLAGLGPAVQVERASDLPAALRRLCAGRYDLVVSGDRPGGARTGLFLRHLCERRFPGLPFVHLPAGDGDPLQDCLEQAKRLL
jgi:hypothetical protein